MDRRPGLGPRFLARLLDGLILFVPTLVLTVPLGGGLQAAPGRGGFQAFVANVVAVTISFGYHVWLECTQGRTLGKRALGLVVASGEGLPTPGEAARRNAFVLLSLVPGLTGGLLSLGAAIAIAATIAMDPEGRGVHDRFADLTVIRESAT